MTKSKRGFASMDAERQREIASKGGKAAHAQGRAHEFTTAEARDAGRKGGMIIGSDREHMARIGKLGGEAKRKEQEGGQGRMNIRQLVAASEALFNCKHPSVLHRGIAVCSECGAMRATDGAGQVQWLKPPLVIAIRDALQAPEDNKDA